MAEANRKRKPRSPIKSFIRPRPGAVPREQLLDKYDEIAYWLICALVLTVTVVAFSVAYSLWPRILIHLYIGTLLGGWTGFVFYWWRHRSSIRNLKLALDGECEVAQTLDELREHGYQIVHSIRCFGFDIDHAVIGPSGVYAVETKTISKRGGAEEQVHWDGKTIRVGESVLSRDPVTQSRAVAKQLRNILSDQTGESVFVQPTLVFPGWFVANKVGQTDLWVENPTQLVKRIRTAPEHLEPKDVRRLTNAILRYQRDEERRQLKLK